MRPVENLPEPWERQPGESSAAFGAWVVYRDLGPRRSFAAVAREQGRTNKKQLEKWSRQWAWQARVVAWENEEDRIRRESHFEAIREMADRHAKHAQALGTALMQPAQALLRRIQRDGTAELEDRKLGSLVHLVMQAAYALNTVWQAEREARGLPTATLGVSARIEGEVEHTHRAEYTLEALSRDPELAAEATRLLGRLADVGPSAPGGNGRLSLPPNVGSG